MMTLTLLPLLALPLSVGGGLLEIDEGPLNPADPVAWSSAGESVATDSGRAVVGARWDDTLGTDAGAVYLFERNSGAWTQEAKIFASDSSSADQFGNSVAIHGDTLVVGAPTADIIGSNEGAAYVFVYNGAAWVQQAKLLGVGGADEDRLGTSVAIQGDRIVVGAMGDDDQGSFSGSAYVFVRNGTLWSQQAKLLSGSGGTNTYFGSSVAIDQDTILIGAPGVGGGAYVFVDGGGGAWTLQAGLTDVAASWADRFGDSVALHGDTAVIGSPFDDDNGTDSGSVFVFNRTGVVWTQGQMLVAGEMFGELGASVSFRGSALAAGAPADRQLLGDDPLGAVYLFSLQGTIWSQGGQIAPIGLASAEEFGAAVSFDGESLVVGIPGLDGLDGGVTNSGGARAYQIVPGPELYCFGDGVNSSCPCGNEGGIGGGCANSTGVGAMLEPFGLPSLAADDLVFDAVGLVPGQAALLFGGLNAVNGGDGLLFGDGLRCAGGAIVRLGVKVPDGGGGARWGPGLLGVLALNPADIRRFQAWYRDPAGGPCGSGFNLSNGVEISFVP
jgi:hypothetical protein